MKARRTILLVIVVLALCNLTMGVKAGSTDPLFIFGDSLLKIVSLERESIWVQVDYLDSERNPILFRTDIVNPGQPFWVSVKEALGFPDDWQGWAVVSSEGAFKAYSNAAKLENLTKDFAFRVINQEFWWITVKFEFYRQNGSFTTELEREIREREEVVVNISEIVEVPDGWHGYVLIKAEHGTIWAEVVEPTLTPTPTMTPTATPTVTPTATPTTEPTPPSYEIYLPLILKNFELPVIIKDYRGQ